MCPTAARAWGSISNSRNRALHTLAPIQIQIVHLRGELDLSVFGVNIMQVKPEGLVKEHFRHVGDKLC